MMKNKHIITITLLTSLLASRVSKSQEFYTCVPKKSWWVDTIKTANKKNEFRQIITLTPKSPTESFTQTLYPGKYKVVIAAAGGDAREKTFILEKNTIFKACVGAKGSSGGSKYGGDGGGGNGYDGKYSGGQGGAGLLDISNPALRSGLEGKGYGNGKGGNGAIFGEGGFGGYGCYGGGGGGGGKGKEYTGGGGGGGSYFKVADVELILSGAEGGNYGIEKAGKGANPDGYLIIYKFE